MNDQSKPEYSYWPQFDAYIKKVIKRTKASLIRQEARGKKVLTLKDTIILAYLDRGHEEDYPSDHYCLYMDGTEMQVDDEQLYLALQQLPDKLLHVIMLKFWRRESEKEISAQPQVSVRSCYARRKKALTLLKQYMEESDGERAE